MFFYLAAREAYGGALAAAVTAACYALNPNLLYLGSIPMTEVVFLAALRSCCSPFCAFAGHRTGPLSFSPRFASIVASLTRYDGWFLTSFFTVGFFGCARRYRYRVAALFLVLASLAPLYWFAHNYWETSDFLSFYRGPYSAKAIYQRALEPVSRDTAATINWHSRPATTGLLGSFVRDGRLVALGIVGAFFAFRSRRFLPVVFLSLTPLFYIWSMYSSGTPIFLPFLHSQGYYNTRYGIAVLPLAAFAAGAMVLAIPNRWKTPLC